MLLAARSAVRVTIEDVRGSVDYDEATRAVSEFLREYAKAAGAEGFVVGLSGGVDSSTAAALAVRAVGSSSVVGLAMPDVTSTPPEDVEDARAVGKLLGVKWYEIPIDGFLEEYGQLPFYSFNRVAWGNLKARIRMTLLYYYANLYNFLVLGAGDKSELLIGYFTKYGDGAVDVLSLGDLYKTQVRELALKLGLPLRVALKPSSPRLWPGQSAEGELGLSYEAIDVVLYSHVELKLSPSEIPAATDLSREVVERVLARVKSTEHKRRLPPIAKVPRRPR